MKLDQASDIMKIRLNSILMILVSMVFVFFFFSEKNGTYLSGSEAQVYLLIVVALAALLINFRFKNEFLEILNLIFVLFYICRIPFIFSDNMESDVISKNVDVSNIPWCITVLTLQYLSLVICIIAVNPRIPRGRIGFIPEFIFKKVLLFSFFILLVNIAIVAFWFNPYIVALSNLPAILTTIFTHENVLMLVIVSSIMVEKRILAKYKFTVILFLLLDVSYVTYQGGKAGLLVIILMGYLAMVVVHGPLIFKLRGLLITGTLGLISFVLYFVAKIFRMYQFKSIDIDEMVPFFYKNIIEDSSVSVLLYSISYRIGYFDFFVEKVSNPVYEPFISFTYYFKSLTDKLTPGFDIFDVPFMSRAIYSTYYGPSDVMNSELITVFAESHLLLGFFSFILYLLILFFIRRLLLSYRSSSGIAYGLYYMYIVYMFNFWLSGFGLDMLIAFFVYQGMFVFFTIWLIKFWHQGDRLGKFKCEPACRPDRAI